MTPLTPEQEREAREKAVDKWYPADMRTLLAAALATIDALRRDLDLVIAANHNFADGLKRIQIERDAAQVWAKRLEDAWHEDRVRLEAELDAARADAARLDWLERVWSVEVTSPAEEQGPWHITVHDGKWRRGTGLTLRAALDAAHTEAPHD